MMRYLLAPQPPDSIEMLFVAVAVLVATAAAAAVYLLPTIIAYRKQKGNRAAILALNIFLGWTFLGWLIALIWALKIDPVDLLSNANFPGRGRGTG